MLDVLLWESTFKHLKTNTPSGTEVEKLEEL